MLNYMLFAILSALSATPSGAAEPVATPNSVARKSDAQPTYTIMLPDGKKLPVFWDERQEQQGSDWVRVQIDEPWDATPQFWQGKLSAVTVSGKERPSAREKRRKEGWDKNGFVEIDGHYVLKTEVDLAQRAREMAGITGMPGRGPADSHIVGVAQKLQAGAESASGHGLQHRDAADPGAAAKHSGSGGRWAAAAGLVAVAALLITLVVRTLLT